MMHRYTIMRRDEEACCERCGAPLMVGDRAYMTGREMVACSIGCARWLDWAAMDARHGRSGEWLKATERFDGARRDLDDD